MSGLAKRNPGDHSGNINLTEDELGFLMSALRQQSTQTRGLDPLQMTAAQLEDVNTCLTIGSKAVDFEHQEMIGDEFTFNVPLTAHETSYLVVMLRGMLGRFAYDAEYSEHQLSLQGGSDDPSVDTLLNDDFCHQLASKLGHRI
jgi:hypothetical protein